MLFRHPHATDAPSSDWAAEHDRALAERLAKFHRRHQGQRLLNWLAMIPFVVVVAWALVVGASSLFVH
jgi:hypothetical protein